MRASTCPALTRSPSFTSSSLTMPGIGGLHDLQIALRHELALRHGDDVQAPERGPDRENGEEHERRMQHHARQR